jgi:DNA ligase 1
MTFAELSGYFKELENTSSRIQMTEILAGLFKKAHQDEIGKICYLLGGRVVPLYEALEFGIADRFVIRAIAIAYNIEQDKVTAEFKKTGDLGITAENLKSINRQISKSASNKLTIIDIFNTLQNIAIMSGTGSQDQKITKLAELLSEVDALSARYLVRIPLDKLRLGFSEMTILDALSWMIKGDKSLRVKLEEAYNVRPDIGFIAEAVKEKGIAGLARVKAKVGAPIMASLCQRLPTADEMIEKMGTVAVEPKYDGVRVQIHYQRIPPFAKATEGKQNSPSGILGTSKFRVQSYSRNLENTTAMFPELNEIGIQLNAEEVILDSEAVGIDKKSGKIVPFQETTTRKRKHDIDLFSEGLPIRFFVFDILYKDNEDLLSTPLSKRRKILESTIKKGPVLEISPQIITSDAEELRNYHDDQLKKGLEGAVVKKWESPYEPGRRGFSWVKFKEEEGKTGKLADTIDAVVMGYYRGEGKRAGFGIGAFLVGIRKEEEFVTITKIGTGVSDDLWKELYKRLEKLKTSFQPKEYINIGKAFIPDVWIAPELVVELAGDDLTRSPNHGAGYAVRFPRLVRIRDDKSPQDITSTKEIKKMFENQGGNNK